MDSILIVGSIISLITFMGITFGEVHIIKDFCPSQGYFVAAGFMSSAILFISCRYFAIQFVRLGQSHLTRWVASLMVCVVLVCSALLSVYSRLC